MKIYRQNLIVIFNDSGYDGWREGVTFPIILRNVPARALVGSWSRGLRIDLNYRGMSVLYDTKKGIECGDICEHDTPLFFNVGEFSIEDDTVSRELPVFRQRVDELTHALWERWFNTVKGKSPLRHRHVGLLRKQRMARPRGKAYSRMDAIEGMGWIGRRYDPRVVGKCIVHTVGNSGKPSKTEIREASYV